MGMPELRVHGVSGTPPRNMLYTDPVPLPMPDGVRPESHSHVKVYRKPDAGDFGVDDHVQAFHWGGLTSGSVLSAFWVLLLPFSMANVAGWTAKNRSPWTVRFVRAFGLVLTGVFVNLAVTASVDFFWRWSYGRVPEWAWWLKENRKLLVVVLFLAIGWLWWGIVSLASTRSHFSSMGGRVRRRLLWGVHPDSMLPPVGGPSGDDSWLDPSPSDVTDDLVWGSHAILHRLRRIHFGFGFLVLTFSAAVATDTGWRIGAFPLFDWPTGIVLMLIALNVVVLLASGPGPRPTGGLVRRLTAIQPHLGAAAFLGSLIVLATSPVETADRWAHIRDTSTLLLIVASATLLLVWAKAGRVSASAATLGTFFGVVLGAAAIFSLSGLLGEGGQVVQGLNWLAAAVLIWLLIVVCVVLWSILIRIDKRRRSLWDAVHDMTGSLGRLWVGIPAVGLAGSALAVWRRCAGREGGEGWFEACVQTGHLSNLPQIVGVVATTLAGLALLLAVWMFIRAKKVVLGLGVLVGVPLGFAILRATGIGFLGIDFSFSDVETAAQTFAIILPAGLLVSRMISGITGGSEARRGFAVIWDVIMFWPRWFHPLAPPAYGPNVVTRLRSEIRRRADPGESGDSTCPLVVAAHSQGTVITLVALAGLAGTTRESPSGEFECEKPEMVRNLGLLTYGCPIDHLYDRYFPSAGFTAVARAMAVALDVSDGSGGRWANLHRATDPIGGPLLEPIDVPVPDPVVVDGEEVYRMHSFYEPTEQFRSSRARIETRLGQPC